MRHPLPLLAALLAATLLRAAPDLKIPSAEHDFGSRRSGEVVKHAFILENRGNDTLRIHRILTSCGCTVPKTRELELEPGERTDLEVEIDLKGRSGPQRQNVTLHTNDPENRIATLTLVGEAVPAIAVEPRTLNLGLLPEEDGTLEGTVTLTSTTGERFSIREVDTTGGRVETRVSEAEDGKSATIRVTTTPQVGQGHFTDVLLIETDRKDLPRERVLVMWRVHTGLAVTPTTLKLVVPEEPAALTRYFLLKAPPGEEESFEITSVEWPEREIEVSYQNLARLGWRIKVGEFVPSLDMAGEKLVIRTNSKEFPEVRIPVETAPK